MNQNLVNTSLVLNTQFNIFEFNINEKMPELTNYKLLEVIGAEPEIEINYEPLVSNDPAPLQATKREANILLITSYPPRECGIATYSHDLIKALKSKFGNSFSIEVCALESQNEKHQYPEIVTDIIDTNCGNIFLSLIRKINDDSNIEIVLVQHEFGFFYEKEASLIAFLNDVEKPIVMVFHTVLPKPNEGLKLHVHQIVKACQSIIVMTNNSMKILVEDYDVDESKITVIPHGTHLVEHIDKTVLKEKYNLTGRKVFSTFGLLSSGKSIETTLNALPKIIEQHQNVLFLIIGKTHPSVVKKDGEKYRNSLQEKVEKLQLQNYVKFINEYLPLPILLEYLQLTDIYLFTSNDPHQAVSGTFSYAISCGCPIISTPIPHAREVLGNDAGIIIDFENANQLSDAVNKLLDSDDLRENMSSNGLHKIVSTAWENAAVAHATLFSKIANKEIKLNYELPSINLNHIKKMTTKDGYIQFSKINNPDICSGYTLDDNARALIAMIMHFEKSRNIADLAYITTYFNFIKYCMQAEGYFLNYVNEEKEFTAQNNETNLADANGRAIWALGFLISNADSLPETLVFEAENLLKFAITRINTMHSTRAMAFAVKGLYYYNTRVKQTEITELIKTLANRLMQMYKHEAETDWEWFESYLTYANSILPEALLCAYQDTHDADYKAIAKSSFDFLLNIIFTEKYVKVISNKGWQNKGESGHKFGEQPIDVAYTILALNRFYEVFKEETYLQKMQVAFSWFLGNNHLQQIIYNPCTGGCYDGLEEKHINLNQGAESTISYLLSRLTIEKYWNTNEV